MLHFILWDASFALCWIGFNYRTKKVISLRTWLCSCGHCRECCTRKGPSPNCCHKVKSTLLSKTQYVVVLIFPLIEPKAPFQDNEKQKHKKGRGKGCPHTFGHLLYSLQAKMVTEGSSPSVVGQPLGALKWAHMVLCKIRKS